MRRTLFSLTGILMCLLAGCAIHAVVYTGTIVFFGDSITQLADKEDGYLTILRQFVKSSGRDVDIVNAGISGNKVTDLWSRLDRDVLSRRPSTVVIYIGINDVWHWHLPGLQGTSRDTFSTVLRRIVRELQRQSVHVILCTPSVIGEKKGRMNPQDEMLDEYAEATRTIARQTNVPLCDLRQSFLRTLEEQNSSDVDRGILTTDRVHLNAAGNRLVAREMIEILGWDRPVQTNDVGTSGVK